MIDGYYGDANNLIHAFLQAPEGSFTTFDAPGERIQATAAFSVNPEDAATGVYIHANTVLHGFLRDPNGTFTTFDAPDACQSAGQGARPEFISRTSVIVGL